MRKMLLSVSFRWTSVRDKDENTDLDIHGLSEDDGVVRMPPPPLRRLTRTTRLFFSVLACSWKTGRGAVHKKKENGLNYVPAYMSGEKVTRLLQPYKGWLCHFTFFFCTFSQHVFFGPSGVQSEGKKSLSWLWNGKNNVSWLQAVLITVWSNQERKRSHKHY